MENTQRNASANPSVDFVPVASRLMSDTPTRANVFAVCGSKATATAATHSTRSDATIGIARLRRRFGSSAPSPVATAPASPKPSASSIVAAAFSAFFAFSAFSRAFSTAALSAASFRAFLSFLSFFCAPSTASVSFSAFTASSIFFLSCFLVICSSTATPALFAAARSFSSVSTATPARCIASRSCFVLICSSTVIPARSAICRSCFLVMPSPSFFFTFGGWVHTTQRSEMPRRV
mmetsp:Transcript_12916/g.48294  ORF Transcript_12916/g.48294 Transcript_12916/m.48294 type:complete len:235 (+) Transcript_12916:1253-1957(+)